MNEFIEKAQTADGFVFGSPTHFDGPYGNLVSFMNRVFYSDCISGNKAFWLKPVAAIACARRSGTTSAVAQMQKFFIEMTIIQSRYNSCAFGNSAEEVKRDKEGMQNMRIIGRNMAYCLKCREAANKAGVKLPKQEPAVSTNMI